MSENTGQIIIILLAMILGVLLFGRDAVGPWIGWGLGIFFVLGVIFLIVRAIMRSAVPAMAKHMAEETKDGGSRLLVVVVWLGVVGLGIEAVWSTILSMRGIPFRDGFETIPLNWLPLVMVVGGLGANEGLKWLREKLAERRR